MSNTISFRPVQKGKHTRTWLVLRRFAPDHCPQLENCFIPQAVNKTPNAEIIRKKCPSTTKRGKFDVVYEVVQEDEPTITTSLIGRLPADMRSLMAKLCSERCPFDLIYAYGLCDAPNRYNQFDKLEIFENVIVTSYDHDETGSFDETGLTDDVTETIELEASHYYEYAKPLLRSSLLLSSPEQIRDMTYCDQHSCGDMGECGDRFEDHSDGCQKVYALVADPTALPDPTLSVYESVDGGFNWTNAGLVTGAIDTSTAYISCLGETLVVSTFDAVTCDTNYYYAETSDLSTWSAGVDACATSLGPSWSDGTTIFWGGFSGALYTLTVDRLGESPDSVPGTTTLNPITVIDGVNCNYVVAGALSGEIVVIRYGVAELLTTSPTIANIRGISVVDEGVFFVIDQDGVVYYTRNGGASFVTVKDLGGIGHSIHMATSAIGYAVVDAFLYCTADGGCTWTQVTTDALTPIGTQVRILSCDNGNKVMYNGVEEIIAGEDKLSRIYPII